MQATAVVGVFGLTVACTGASEKGLRRAGLTRFERVYLHPGHHAEGVEKRIDVIATAIQLGATVHDLAQAELCYAPQFGAAKDPVNLAGMIAANHLDGDMPLADWSTVGTDDALILDVREPAEFDAGHIPGALNLPLSALRRRHGELPCGREIVVCCGVGQRAYYAVRFLLQYGFRAANLSGGYTTYRALQGTSESPVSAARAAVA